MKENIAKMGDDKIHAEKLKATILQLLDLCAENEVIIPEELKKSLLAEDLAEEKHFGTHKEFLAEQRDRRASEVDEDIVTRIQKIRQVLRPNTPNLELRIKDGSYMVVNQVEDVGKSAEQQSESDASAPRLARQKIRTVRTESPAYKLFKLISRCVSQRGDIRLKTEEKVLMDKVNLVFEPGKMYLVLGGPGSGKSTLLKMIAGNLHKSKDHVQGGLVSLSGVQPKDVVWTNLVSYIDQIDRLYPYATVMETCDFAWECRTGGTHRKGLHAQGEEVDNLIAKLDEERTLVAMILEVLGLARVKDTFVGDQSTVRGVSGGEKKRVTVAEMIAVGAPVVCCDEISTGLDAATTFDITRLFGSVIRITETIKIVSLLQPPPETVANFDELIVLSEGRVIFCGPVDDVIDYFNSLGYKIPERMDVADWLQALPTKEGWKYLTALDDEAPDQNDLMSRHLTTDQFCEKFYQSELGTRILGRLESSFDSSRDTELVMSIAKQKYATSSFSSLKRLVRREMTLWWRDKYQLKAKLVQTLVMGVLVGTLFFDGTNSPTSVLGVMFQSLLFSMIGSMVLIIKQFPARSIFYKEDDANFYPTWTSVLARSIASVPNALLDATVFGTLIYFLVGLAYNDGASIANYFLFMLILFVGSLTAGLFFSIYAACVQTVTIAQACMAVTAVVFVLFSGFTVQPDVIPNYYIWVYWLNFVSWMLRALIVNEYDSGKYDYIPSGQNETQGNLILTQFGFTFNEEPFIFEWAWWGVLFTFAIALASICATTIALKNIRFATGKTLVTDQGEEQADSLDGIELVEIPFKRVDLTFRDIHYTVRASTSDEKLELLKGISGVIEGGKMTALMGSSGAGKTTLMDVLAMRKSTGEITGEIRLNGHLQEEQSFRRCTGYVEQFDVQTPQLTVRETLEFSAAMRLDEKDPAVTPETTTMFVEQTLAMLELTRIQNLQVGTDETGGLSFEQRKRLSIAIEVVANPSIIFLDEPTSGLDARAASIVMRGMRRIALAGRAICATIHQPSVAIFNDFDALLLLKRGGETVFFGDLGHESRNLIDYLERYEATPKIQPGENPATWMLTTIGARNSASKRSFDYAAAYENSKLRTQCLEAIEAIKSKASEENKVSFSSKYATSRATQSEKVLKRAMKVYFRSPQYNMTRLLVSGVIALLFSSVYASQRVPKNESDMNSRVNSIFIAAVFLCVNAMNTVLSVFECERNMFYRHRAANMYNARAISKAFTLAEIPFIILTAVVFVILFYFIMGFADNAKKFFLFLLFFVLSLATFTFTGQMLVALLRDSQTAQGFGGLLVSATSLFSGVLIRPDEIPSFWIFMYWIMPGHYLMEGLLMSQFDGDNTPIEATPGSPFYIYLGCSGDACEGTAFQWILANFVDFSTDSVKWDILYFVAVIVFSRGVCYYALTNLDYRAT